MQARRVNHDIYFQGKSVSKYLEPFFLGMTYIDNAHGKVDDLTITLQDRDNIWLDGWLPETLDSVTASIQPINWASEGHNPVLNCGKFQIDEMTAKGYPRIIEIKAVSVTIDSVIRREKHSKTWEKVNLEAIAKEVAKAGGLELFYDTDEQPYYGNKYQHDMSDLEFVQKLCEDSGLNLKISDGKLVIFDARGYELKPATFTIKSDDPRLIDYSFKAQAHEVYKGATVRYYDEEDKKTLFYKYFPDSLKKFAQILNIDERVESIKQAQVLAKKRLRESNTREITGQITLFGDTDIFAGNNFALDGFGMFDGKYAIEKATHTLTKSGFSTAIDFHKCLEDY